MMTTHLQKAHLEEYVLTSRLLHGFQYSNFRLSNFYDLLQCPALPIWIPYPHEAQNCLMYLRLLLVLVYSIWAAYVWERPVD